VTTTCTKWLMMMMMMIRAVIDIYSESYMKHDNTCMKHAECTNAKASGRTVTTVL
jgi:NADH:ubiquinone oxidoreductase subunit 5 (subunit L)/multisubunit Na+/H+ antiporter MnhA subunit